MLNPYLLLFLPLMLVPILLHLITMQRLRTVELSTFRFLMDSYVQQRRKVKLLEFVLMLLRAAFVALVVATLSRPVVEKFAWLAPGSSGRDITLVIDAGLTMNARSAGTSSLERAKEAAKAIVNRLDGADRVRLMAVSDRPRVLAERFAHEPGALLEAIDGIEAGAVSANMAGALAEIAAEQRDARRLVYVLSDFNRHTWSRVEEARSGAATDDAPWVLLDVGAARPVSNLGVLAGAPPTSHAVVGLPVMLTATVANGRADQPADAVLSLIVEDQQVSQEAINLPAGGKATRRMSFIPRRPGVIRGRFELPADDFPDDDTLLFSLNVQPHLEVLLVRPGGNTAREDDDATYVRAALMSPLLARGGETQQQQLAAALRITTIEDKQVNAALLEPASVVILADVPMTKPLGDALRGYLRDGGGVIVLPGRHVRGEVYPAHLLRADIAAADAALVRLGDPQGDPDDERTFVGLTDIDFTHPILECFHDPSQRYFGTARLYRRFPLDPRTEPLKDETGAQPAPVKVLMRQTDKKPALVEIRIGRGRALVASFPAAPAWSNVPVKPEFVPLLLRAVEYLRRPPLAALPAAVTPGQPAVLTLTSRWPRAQVEAADSEGRTSTLDLHRDGEQILAPMLATGRKGYYDLTIHPRAQGADDQMKMGFAVNLDARDATLESMDAATLKQVLGRSKVTYLKGTADDPILTEQLTSRREIWRTLIWVTFAVIGLEFLLATLGPGRGVEEMTGQMPQQRRVWRRWRGAA